MWAHLKWTFFGLEITSQYFLFMCFFKHIYSSYVRNQCLTFDLVLDFVKIQNFGWKYRNVSTSQVDFFWTGNNIPILPVYMFLRTYLLKLCQESMLDIWPSSRLCKHSKVWNVFFESKECCLFRFLGNKNKKRNFKCVLFYLFILFFLL